MASTSPESQTGSCAESLPEPSIWVDQYGEALLKYAASKVSNLSTAEDLVQETLLSAFEQRTNYRGDAAFKTWLLGILKRKIADHYRRHARDATHEQNAKSLSHSVGTHANEFERSGAWNRPPRPWPENPSCDSTRSPDQLIESAEFWGVVSECLSDMPDHLARAFRKRILAGQAHEEVCQREGISKKNLSVRLHRARLLIRRCLEKIWINSEG